MKSTKTFLAKVNYNVGWFKFCANSILLWGKFAIL
jgi:hypothetical protein